MQLLLCVTALAMCVLCAQALPNDGTQMMYEPNLESFKVQLLASKIDTRALSPAETTCADIYNNRNKNINDKLIAQTNNCFENANKTTVYNNRTNNGVVTLIRRDISTVQFKLGNCSNLQENNAFLNCITQSFDNNLNLLDSTNSRAYQVMSQSSSDLTQVYTVRQGCTNSVIGHSKVELTQSATEYNSCLDRARQKRFSQKLGIYG